MKDVPCPCCKGGRGRYLGFNVPLNSAEKIESFQLSGGSIRPKLSPNL